MVLYCPARERYKRAHPQIHQSTIPRPMSHQIPPAHPIAHANAANQQQPFLYGYPQGLVPLAYPLGLPPPPFTHPYPNSHSQFMQPPPPMPNSYGQYPAFGFPVAPSALDPAQISALRSKDRPNREIRPGGTLISALSTEPHLPLSLYVQFSRSRLMFLTVSKGRHSRLIQRSPGENFEAASSEASAIQRKCNSQGRLSAMGGGEY